eukprot:scaffold5980_cov376-Prasinococcus_capsulatus_cf.AAC.8
MPALHPAGYGSFAMVAPKKMNKVFFNNENISKEHAAMYRWAAWGCLTQVAAHSGWIEHAHRRLSRGLHMHPACERAGRHTHGREQVR